jgi:lysophospholipase L1-like esterase
VQVINAGIPGHASFEAVGRLFAEGHLFDPDYVLLYAEWNDIKDYRQTEPLLRLHRPTMGWPTPGADPNLTYQNALDRTLSGVSQLYNRLRWRYYSWKYRIGPEGSMPRDRTYASIFSKTALAQYRMNVQTFVDVVRNAGARPVLVTEARLVARTNGTPEKKRINYTYALLTHEALCDAFDATDEILREVSEEKNIPLLDASARFSGKDELFTDHIHLTPRGSTALAEFLAASMVPLLAETSVE